MKTTAALIASLVLLVGCAAESASQEGDNAPADLTPANAELSEHGVGYIKAEGKAEAATITLYDRDQKVIGGGQVVERGSMHAEYEWKGVCWEANSDSTDEDGVDVMKDGVRADAAVAKEYSEVQTIFDAAFDQARLPSEVAQAQACKKKGSACGTLKHICCSKSKCKMKTVFGWVSAGVMNGRCR
jgi:hypothetical protein